MFFKQKKTFQEKQIYAVWIQKKVRKSWACQFILKSFLQLLIIRQINKLQISPPLPFTRKNINFIKGKQIHLRYIQKLNGRCLPILRSNHVHSYNNSHQSVKKKFHWSAVLWVGEYPSVIFETPWKPEFCIKYSLLNEINTDFNSTEGYIKETFFTN